jgi:PhnB protein
MPQMKVTPYLNFDGTCAEAFRFYEKELGGKVTFTMPYSQAPPNSNIPPDMADRILHAEIQIGDNKILASDTPPGRAQPMRSAYLCLSVDSTPEAERIFSALTNQGEVLQAMEETFFAHRFGSVRDRYGVLWMIIHERSMQPPA